MAGRREAIERDRLELIEVITELRLALRRREGDWESIPASLTAHMQRLAELDFEYAALRD